MKNIEKYIVLSAKETTVLNESINILSGRNTNLYSKSVTFDNISWPILCSFFIE